MRISKLDIQNFRGISSATFLLPNHAVLIGDNNTGKTTILEAIDLALGPDRLNRAAPIDEHDFFRGNYVAPLTQPTTEDNSSSVEQEDAVADSDKEDENAAFAPEIKIEVLITGLSDEQRARFGNDVEWWDTNKEKLYESPNPTGVDKDNIVSALRVTFVGRYVPEDDDFEGNSYFTRSLIEGETPVRFRRTDKQKCGFLYLRSLRTGSRALSLERGSLLDIILRLKDLRPQMWEKTLSSLSDFTVASDPDLGIVGVLESINASLKKYVPKEWGVEPHLRVSNLTREHLRKVITAFIATGDGTHAAPFYRQGTGTINMLVLAMLSQIAQDKQNVIFAMEEPETAIPPYAQKRIVHEVRNLSSQTIFTSHSPYVLEEFELDQTIVISRDNEGVLSRAKIELPESVKPKRYRQEFRTRFCEGLLARRILIAEGATEASSMPAVAKRLSEIDADKYTSLEALGICTVDAGGETNIADMADLYRDLGKTVFVVCDKQPSDREAQIKTKVHELFMHQEKTFEDLVIKGTTDDALRLFAKSLDWPQHILSDHPDPETDAATALRKYFDWSKGNWGTADFLAQCAEDEIPEWICATCQTLKQLCDPAPELTEENPKDGEPVSDGTD